MERLRNEGTSFRGVAAHITAMDIRTSQGFRWYQSTARRAVAQPAGRLLILCLLRSIENSVTLSLR